MGPGYPKSLVAVAEERGAMCIETLVERVVLRLQYAERLLAHALTKRSNEAPHATE